MIGISVRRRRGAIALALALAVAALFARAIDHEFVTFDDTEYVSQNPRVTSGLSLANARWALTAFHAANWHPLTWLSHQLDAELWGLDPRGHHATNVLLHAAIAALLFLLLAAATGREGASLAVALLWALHPLRVEVVAWVAERKELLAVLLALLTVAFWGRWVRGGGRRFYAAALLAFALGLAAKPMLVTLPCALVLLDLWPFGRSRTFREVARRLPEKLPLFALAAVSSLVTIAAQSAKAAVAPLSSFPLWARLPNAPVSVLHYLGDSLLPTGLAVFYPHPATLGRAVGWGTGAAAALVLVLATVAALREHDRRPWLTVGWSLFLGMLVPVLGLVQVGSQARADRYTYLPSIGLTIVVVWGALELAERFAIGRAARIVTLAAVTLLLAVGSFRQIGFWRDSEALYRRAIAVTDGNWTAWNNLGAVLLARGQPREALAAFESAVRIDAEQVEPWYNAGVVLYDLKEFERAEAALREALRLGVRGDDSWRYLGLVLQSQGRFAEAEAAHRRELEVDPRDPASLFHLALLAARGGARDEARALTERLRAVDERTGAELEAILAGERRPPGG